MQDPFPTIRGVPFWPLGHHDGRFVRTPGLYAFARRQPNGRFLVLHLGLADAINRDAVVGHPRWSWALGQRMDSLLVHLFGARVALPGGDHQRHRYRRLASGCFCGFADLPSRT